MSFWHNPSSAEKPYAEPTPLPDDVPKVQELGVTSAPLKSAAFFIGAYCKDYNGAFVYFALSKGGDGVGGVLELSTRREGHKKYTKRWDPEC